MSLSDVLKVLGGLLLLACLILFGVVGVPVSNPFPTIAAYAVVGLAGAAAYGLGDHLDR